MSGLCDRDNDDPLMQTGHALVRHPSGLLLDIDGLHAPTQRFAESYWCDGWREFTLAEQRKAWGKPSISSHSYVRARAVAGSLVEFFADAR